ncbi:MULTISPECIES: hypothetical protein [Mycolicibacterium]|uniref:Uncharacterized protein n=1 Tax=Mycolicibacterium mageritense TaxID=53462 RepID=A0AAI8XMQ0_MYCME|nr:hypothetical protein [Mycolicibacterium mageritense]TXI65787.1 MAG: hypothetical protein E6Q55_00740 [Mycolicibacterium mageritense]BDY27973.1 hypothetical protein hbim_01903 [Mycolicibacterium mageritense]
MKIKGPIATLGAVAALGTGIWLVNVNSQPEPRPAATATATATSAPAAAPVAPPAPPTPTAAPFGAREDFVATIPTKNGDLGLEIRVTGTTARAYACDNKGIETWLSGSALNGLLKLDSADKTSHLEGRHVGNTVVGNLRIGEKNWDFTATPGETNAL